MGPVRRNAMGWVRLIPFPLGPCVPWDPTCVLSGPHTDDLLVPSVFLVSSRRRGGASGVF